jgi:Protein of unknown function (DUF1565)
VPAIKQALELARGKNIVIIAPAGHNEAHSETLFPANLENTVICIGSEDANGAPSPYNPPTIRKNSYSVTGEAVQIAKIGHVTEVRLGGPRIAVMVAAGIAALLIEHTSAHSSGLEAINFKHMCQLFHLISKPVEGIKYYRTLDPTLIPDKCTEQALSGRVAIEIMGLTV